MTKADIEKEIKKGNFRYARGYKFIETTKEGRKELKVDYKNANKNYFLEEHELIEYFQEKYPQQEFIILGDDGTEKPLEKMTKAQMVEYAKEKGILITEDMKRHELLKFIKDSEQGGNITMEGEIGGENIGEMELPEGKIGQEPEEIKKEAE